MTVLLVCPDEGRSTRLRDAIHSAGFSLITAKALDEAWAKSDFFEFGAVVIDHPLNRDIAAAAFRQRFITLNLQQDAAPELVAIELRSLFHPSSGRVH